MNLFGGCWDGPRSGIRNRAFCESAFVGLLRDPIHRIGSSNYDADVMGALAPYQLLTWQRSDS